MDDVSPAGRDGGTTEIYTLLVAHALGQLGSRTDVIFRRHESASRYVRVPPCDDCGAEARTTPRPADGYRSSLLIEHSPTCPLLRAALRRQAGGSA